MKILVNSAIGRKISSMLIWSATGVKRCLLSRTLTWSVVLVCFIDLVTAYFLNRYDLEYVLCSFFQNLFRCENRDLAAIAFFSEILTQNLL